MDQWCMKRPPSTKPIVRGEGFDFFRQIYENNLDAIFLTAPDGRINAANPAACEMFGMTEEEIIRAGRQGLLDTSDPRFAAGLETHEETGMVRVELTGVRKDGTRFPLELTSVVFRDQRGDLLTSTIMIIREISERRDLEARLKENNAWLERLLERLPDVLYTLDLKERRTRNFNRSSFLGYSYEELSQPGSIQASVHPEDAAAVAAYHQKIHQGEQTESLEYRVRNKEGEWEWVDSRKTVLTRNPDGSPREIMVILRVITDRKRAEEQVAYHARILENINDIVVGTDENFNIRYWNNAAERIFGWREEEVLGKDVSKVLRTTFFDGGREESIRLISETGTWKGEVIQFTKDDQPINIDANIMMIRDSAGRAAGFVSANRDITLRKLAEEKLQQAKNAVEVAYAELEHALAREQLLARTDSLTNLFNRRHFFLLADHEFSVAMRYEQPVSAIIFDVDHFKNVNDRWGHHVGDDVLRHVSRIAQKQVRAADILARYGGEEFIILLPNSSAAEAANVAERIRRKVMAYRIDPEHTQAGVTVSVGVAEKDARVQTLDDLVRRADHALYAAKGAGRNCVKIYQASV